MIPRQVVAAFTPTIRGRGEDYFLSQRVQIERSSVRLIEASVSGEFTYAVSLAAAHGTITARCNCPYAGEYGICKHIWATLRQADATQQLDAFAAVCGRDPRLVASLDGGQGPSTEPPRRPPPPPEWKALLETARRQMRPSASGRTDAPTTWPNDVRLVYVIDAAAMRSASGVVIELGTERLKADGTWDATAQFRMPLDVWQAIPDARDRQIAQMLIGAAPNPYGPPSRPGVFLLTGPAIEITLPLICETGRCRVRHAHAERPTAVVRFDDGPAWTFCVRVMRDTPGKFAVDAVLQRPGEEMWLDEASMLHSAGILLAHDTFARFDHLGAFALVLLLREKKRLIVSEAELPALLESLYALPQRPRLELPHDARVTELRDAPMNGVIIHGDPSPWRRTHHRVEPFFMYGARRLTGTERDTSVFDRNTLTVHHRDIEHEAAARATLFAAGAKEEWQPGEQEKCLALHGSKLMRTILDLVASGWRVEAEGAVYRSAGDAHASVRSGIDWFELSAGVRYGDIDVSLHELLAARRAGSTTIELSDGSRGVIPAEWLAKLAPLIAGGKAANGVLRFARSQTALLDALLAAIPKPDVDAAFEKARAELASFERVSAADPPKTFRGTLREYQREALGWFHFLRTFGLGGCLADDMGLGKTVEVLALLEARRVELASEEPPSTPKKRGKRAPSRRPSLVVVPRSLVFNWLREAGRFAPKLRMLDYTGTTRRIEDITSGSADVILTTYGTLRRDALALSAINFDYAILDEAQAIKSGGSASAKAARLLRADYRLAMTGTPIENRLEELWSLFEFLNPGMLGASTTFAALAKLARPGERGETPPVGRDVFSRALRPVILRRTKAQVATELPARVEQTLHVELEGPQRKFYDGLLEAYRRSVLDRVDRDGLGKTKMHILEALLRLRQAACHPALADPRKTAAPSAKLDALMPALLEVTAEGHKALVFSQFTGFLDLVRERMDAAGLTYEYLDGKTRDRQARVDRFQSDDACPLFLISLKAGGHGLNLTAADYVFILDPWWNPAVEAQAVDRAHRIGQTRRVIATRIVARDTIEEKILELQASKRALADEILGGESGALSEIGRAELEMLLG